LALDKGQEKCFSLGEKKLAYLQCASAKAQPVAFKTVGLSPYKYKLTPGWCAVRNNLVYAVFAVVIVAGLVTSAFLLSYPMGRGVTSSTLSSGTVASASSQQAGEHTFNATYTNTMARCCITTSATTSSSETSMSSTTSTASSSSYSTTTSQSGSGGGGSFNYAASSEVKILSVAAVLTGGDGSPQTVSFVVKAQNTEDGNITVLEGGGSSLNSTIVSGGSVITSVSGPRCEIAEAPVPIRPGGTWTSTSPGCWSGYYYELLQQGTIDVQLTLNWGGGSGGGASGTLAIEAEFTL
jgi:hypothetical protein